MGCDSAYCTCEPKLAEVPEELIDGAYLGGEPAVLRQPRVDEVFLAEQPGGWRACLKQKTRCVIEVHDLSDDAGYFGGRMVRIEATNSCHVEDAEVCPRVTAGSKSGEGYELCGPPNHAEQEAAKLLLEVFPNGIPGLSVAKLYGHTWLCMDCQHALVAAGVTTFVVTGEPA